MMKINHSGDDVQKTENGTSNKIEEVDVDEFLMKIGQFGRTQILLVFVFCIIIIPTTYQTLVMTFVASSPEWKCADQNFQFNRTFYDDHCNGTNATNFVDPKFCIIPKCTMNGTFEAKDEKRCDMPRSSWDYTKPKTFSIVTEWDLVCQKKELSYLANSGMFIGWAIGAVILGFVSDRYGRKIVLFPSWAGIILAAFASGFVQNFWLFFALRVWIGFFQGGVGLTLFVIATELVGPKYRSLAGTSLWFAFTLALCALAFQAWLVPKWRTIEIIISIPYIFILGAYWIVPESIRWLRVNGKIDEAELILKKVARINKVSFPQNVKLSSPTKNAVNERASFKDLFVPYTMCVSTLVQCFAWFVNGQVYYGISLASDQLGGNMYRDFVLTSLVEIPANIIAVICTNRYGRKPSAIWSMIIGGLACVGVAFINPDTSAALKWTRVSMGMLGKLCITLSFSSIYIWSAELYPTIVRSQGMGMMSVVSRIGAASAPWVAQWLDHVHKYLPFGIMGGLTIISAILLVVLPETKGKATAETLQDSASADKAVEMEEVVGHDNAPKGGIYHENEGTTHL